MARPIWRARRLGRDARGRSLAIGFSGDVVDRTLQKSSPVRRNLSAGDHRVCVATGPRCEEVRGVRREASVLHLDLDAFFAAVEQRDKPSLRGRPVVVGGVGGRGVVATASYEARAYGARSAMSTAEARRRCPPGTAFLGGRFGAYRRTSEVVMELLRELSPLVEPVSIDEAYVDLAAGGGHDLSVDGVTALAGGVEEGGAPPAGGGGGAGGPRAGEAVGQHRPRTGKTG